MMKKKAKHIVRNWKLGDFFRNFAAVVLGIILTFIGSDLITKYKNQQEMKQAMQLVKDELLTNRKTIEDILARELAEQAAAKYLLNHKDSLDKVPQDSINRHAPLPGRIGTYSYTADALEMLKTSSLMQQIKNKELSMQIIRSYDAIKSANLIFGSFIDTKKMFLEKIFADKKLSALVTQQQSQESMAKMWQEMLRYPEGISLLQMIITTHSPNQIYIEKLTTIDNAIAAIEKEYE